ncbi:hypothetical protein HUJ04_009601 [Dendroctonus ponderosae]|nr:hypothetical protein HUJ04_009601 [Dendroctonus ponderosae]
METKFDVRTFTCTTCNVQYLSPEIQVTHFLTDWHRSMPFSRSKFHQFRLNLKRRVAKLFLFSHEEFVAKLEAKRIADLQPKDHGVYCNVCGKSFGTDNAYENHINSKKHKEKAAHFTGAEQSTRARSPVPVEPTEISIDPGENEDDWDDVDNPIDNNDSIFCLKHSKSFMDNLDHMTIVHSFFIPDIEYCSDVQGLLSYLGSKISAGFMCLWCNERGRSGQVTHD